MECGLSTRMIPKPVPRNEGSTPRTTSCRFDSPLTVPAAELRDAGERFTPASRSCICSSWRGVIPISEILAACHRADNHERFFFIQHVFGQWRIRRFEGEIVFAGEEANEWSSLQCP